MKNNIKYHIEQPTLTTGTDKSCSVYTTTLIYAANNIREKLLRRWDKIYVRLGAYSVELMQSMFNSIQYRLEVYQNGRYT